MTKVTETTTAHQKFEVSYGCQAHADLARDGYLVFDDFLTSQQCEAILDLISLFRKEHQMAAICRSFKDRSLRYSVINGEQVETYLPDAWALYETINEFVNTLSERKVYPLGNKLPTANINVIRPGGEYRWHYDRNAVTALLYLNTVESGELEMYPNYRIGYRHTKHFNAKYSRWQQWLDALLGLKLLRHCFGQKKTIQPQQGMLVVMNGDRCLHSVAPLLGEKERINVVMAYDTPETVCSVEQALDAYLYTTQATGAKDANYR